MLRIKPCMLALCAGPQSPTSSLSGLNSIFPGQVGYFIEMSVFASVTALAVPYLGASPRSSVVQRPQSMIMPHEPDSSLFRSDRSDNVVLNSEPALQPFESSLWPPQ